MSVLWLCAYFPQLGLEVCQRQHAAAPVVLSQTANARGDIPTGGTTGPRPTVLLADNRVIARDALAVQRGIAIGASLAAAHSIATDLLHLHQDLTAEAARLEYLGQVLYGFSSQVSLDSTPAGYLETPGAWHQAVLLEISASLKLFGGLETLLARIATQLDALGHDGLLTVAPTPLAALCLGRWRQRDGAAPARLLPGTRPWQHALETMPVSALGLEPRQGEQLDNMGLRACGALLQLPSKAIAQRFGTTLSARLARLTGAHPDPRPTIDPPARFGHSLHLLEACTSKAALLFPIKRLCGEFGHWLVGQQLGVSRWRWTVADHAGDRAQVDVHASQPLQSPTELLRLTQWRLERATLPAEVLDLRLESLGLAPWSRPSESLFPELGNGPNDTPPLELLDLLRARLGERICSGIAPHPDHRPEAAWCEAPPGKRLAAPGAPSHSRPLWLLEAPRPIPRGRLALLHGPERLQGGWWETTARRDYYIARLKDRAGLPAGGRCWVFVDPRERWFIHGHFA
ncbi:MAG: DNA polymerase Y family protein [Pseudomonadota bacterium]